VGEAGGLEQGLFWGKGRLGSSWLEHFHLRYAGDLSLQVLSTVLGFDFDVANPGPSQRFLLDSISRCSGSLIVYAALVLDCCDRIALAGDNEKVDPFAVVLLPLNSRTGPLRLIGR
jgi:hypothetical protein